MNNATAHHRCLRHSTAPRTASPNAKASARLARALMIGAGLKPTVIPIHHGAATFFASRDTAIPAAPIAIEVHAQHGPDRRVARGTVTPTPGTTRVAAVLQSIDVTVSVLHVREGPGDHIELLAVMSEARDEHGIGEALLDEAARGAAIADAQQSAGITVVGPQERHGRDRRDEHAHHEDHDVPRPRRRHRPFDVAVNDLGLVAVIAQAPGDLLGDDHRPVVAPGASERHREVALALGDVRRAATTSASPTGRRGTHR